MSGEFRRSAVRKFERTMAGGNNLMRAKRGFCVVFNCIVARSGEVITGIMPPRHISQ